MFRIRLTILDLSSVEALQHAPCEGCAKWAKPLAKAAGMAFLTSSVMTVPAAHGKVLQQTEAVRSQDLTPEDFLKQVEEERRDRTTSATKFDLIQVNARIDKIEDQVNLQSWIILITNASILVVLTMLRRD